MTSDASTYYRQWLLDLPDAQDRILDRDLSTLAAMIPTQTRIHLIGICGKGTATLAGLLIEKGFTVTGSDSTFYPPMSLVVESLGIRVYKTYDATNVEGANLVITANVCPPDHPEVLAAKAKGILQISMSEALEFFFLQEKKNIIVTGTHGKTTLTGMISWMLEQTHQDPLYFIGGVIQGHQNSHRFSNGPYTVLEGDEYDTAYFDKGPKFLHYKPWCGIITSCEYDHVTMYPSFEEYLQAFRFFIQEIDPAGFLIVHESAAALLKSECAAFSGTVITYGTSATCDYHIEGVSFGPDQSTATVRRGGITEALSIGLPGTFNLENALAAFIVGTLGCGLDPDAVKNRLGSFPGMERRQEVLFEDKDYLFLDDFAHHPTAVRVTLEGLRLRFPDRRIVCLFEPRSSSSRKKIFEGPYSQAFGAADVICICAPALRENDDPADFVDIQHITNLLTRGGKQAYGCTRPAELIPFLESNLYSGDVIVTMSNASFDNIQQNIKELLEKNRASPGFFGLRP